jgi:hypothetical protein
MALLAGRTIVFASRLLAERLIDLGYVKRLAESLEATTEAHSLRTFLGQLL